MISKLGKFRQGAVPAAVEMSDSTPVALAASAMEGITLSASVPPPVDTSGDVAMGEALPPPAPALAPPEQGLPVDACETLYIQNLNETVKIDGGPPVS